MSQRRGIISSPHPHTLKHKSPTLIDPRAFICNGATLEALLRRGQTPLQTQNMRWGMNVQIDNVMHKAERNLMNWKQVVLTTKELNLVLDEHQFEREGGEITWNANNDLEFDSDSSHEDEEEDEGDRAKSPMKESVGNENADEVESDATSEQGSLTKEEIQAFANFSAKQFKKCLNMEHWTDAQVRGFQSWFKCQREERDTFAEKVLAVAKDAGVHLEGTAILDAVAESVAADPIQSVNSPATSSTTDKSQTPSSRTYIVHSLQGSPRNSKTAFVTLQHAESNNFSDEMSEHNQRVELENEAALQGVGRPFIVYTEDTLGKIVLTPRNIFSIQFAYDTEDVHLTEAELLSKGLVMARGSLAARGKTLRDLSLDQGHPTWIKVYRGEIVAQDRGGVTSSSASGLPTKEAGIGLASYARVPQMDFAAQASQENGIAQPHGHHGDCTCTCGKPIDSDEAAPVPQWFLRTVAESSSSGDPSAKPDQAGHPPIDPFECVYPPEHARQTEPFRYTPRNARTGAEELAEIEEDYQTYKKAMTLRKVELMEGVMEQLDKGLPSVARQQWIEEEKQLDIEIMIRTKQYRAMLIAGRMWEKGEMGPPGRGIDAQKKLSFLACDLEEQVRRAGHSFHIRENYYHKLHAAGPGAPVLEFNEEEECAFTGMWGSEYDPALDTDFKAYALQMSTEYQAALRSGMGEAAAAKKAARVVGKKQVGSEDDVEVQIRRRQEAREKQERDRAKMIKERELAKAVADSEAAGKKSKSQKKGKGGGRKHRK